MDLVIFIHDKPMGLTEEDHFMNSNLKEFANTVQDEIYKAVVEKLSTPDNQVFFTLRKTKDFGIQPILECHDPEYVHILRHIMVHHPAPHEIKPIFAHTQLCRHSPIKGEDNFFEAKLVGVHECSDSALLGSITMDLSLSLTPTMYMQAYADVQTCLTAAEYYQAHTKHFGPKLVVALCSSSSNHAAKRVTGGQSIFNHVVIASQRIMKDPWMSRTGILDLTHRHGSGTQSLTYGQTTPVYVSVHPENAYPYHTGKTAERGLSFGSASNYNIINDGSASIEEYLLSLETALEQLSNRSISDLIIEWSPSLINGSYTMKASDMNQISSKIVDWAQSAGSDVNLLFIIDDFIGSHDGYAVNVVKEEVVDAIMYFIEGLTEWHF